MLMLRYETYLDYQMTKLISIKERLEAKGILESDKRPDVPRKNLPLSKKIKTAKGSLYGVGEYGKHTTSK